MLNINNLTRLADYLESLPEDYSHFHMGEYIGLSTDDADYIDTHAEDYTDYARNNGGVDQFGCGTVACAVGHGPAAGILLNPDEFNNPFGDPDWRKYSTRFIDRPYSSEWLWCFGTKWEWDDNHHWGAAARIRYLLSHGCITDEEWEPATYQAFRKTS